MFKKKTKKIKARLRTRTVDDDDDAVDENGNAGGEESSAMDAILQAKKKRKLLNAVQYRRGLDAAETLKAPSSLSAVDPEETSVKTPVPNKDLKERLKGTFSEGAGFDANSGEGVMDQKHKSAMEEFVREKLGSKEEQPPAQDESTEEPSTVRALEQKVYAELASSAQALSGASNKEQSAAEGDVGAGGAMLGGTGIAEVVLPTEDRLANVKATETAAASRGRPAQPVIKQVEPKMETATVAQLPMTFAVGKGKRARDSYVPMAAVEAPKRGVSTMKSGESSQTASSAGFQVQNRDVAAVGGSVSHNFSLHSQEWISKKKEEEQKAYDAANPVPKETTAADQERMGFDAARKVARGESIATGANSEAAGSGKKRSKDERVWRQFMNRQKDLNRR